MTTRRRLLVFGLLAALLALGAVVWLFYPRMAITAENAAKIKQGMTLPEVESILGGSARDESTGLLQQPDSEPRDNLWLWLYIPRINSMPRVREWVTNWLVIQVHFDDEMLVREVTFFPVQVAAESPLDKLRRWLRL